MSAQGENCLRCGHGKPVICVSCAQELHGNREAILRFLGWMAALTREDFFAILRTEGGGEREHIEEKWQDFRRDPLLFTWQWATVFMKYATG